MLWVASICKCITVFHAIIFIINQQVQKGNDKPDLLIQPATVCDRPCVFLPDDSHAMIGKKGRE
ncbi:hypothetical protein VN24_01825 [Paenibacillus beijingensis]|uniref:Uncharacterized protein n=1 Tax=Paenibacillus beijingensis TaxID=1126833 RepID=A0A0D5NEB6_9BACL|nr:hypothetical protein VN24_01825 [Paenibacillus beijingensis]